MRLLRKYLTLVESDEEGRRRKEEGERTRKEGEGREQEDRRQREGCIGGRRGEGQSGGNLDTCGSITIFISSEELCS
jgi:hypothetical protein